MDPVRQIRQRRAEQNRPIPILLPENGGYSQ